MGKIVIMVLVVFRCCSQCYMYLFNIELVLGDTVLNEWYSFCFNGVYIFLEKLIN